MPISTGLRPWFLVLALLVALAGTALALLVHPSSAGAACVNDRAGAPVRACGGGLPAVDLVHVPAVVASAVGHPLHGLDRQSAPLLPRRRHRERRLAHQLQSRLADGAAVAGHRALAIGRTGGERPQPDCGLLLARQQRRRRLRLRRLRRERNREADAPPGYTPASASATVTSPLVTIAC